MGPGLALLGLVSWLSGMARAGFAHAVPPSLQVAVPEEDGRPPEVRTLLPVSTTVDATLSAGLATVTVVHTFENGLSQPFDATYLFPVPDDSAVYRMQLTVGDEVVEGKVMEKQVATDLYTSAKDDGYTAALVQQHRPNVFSQSVANLPPHLPVRVELSYVHPLEREDADSVFHIPVSVAPRYKAEGSGAVDGPEKGLPAAPNLEHSAFDVTVHLDAGAPIVRLDPGTAPFVVESPQPSQRVLTLRNPANVPESDLVIRYSVAGEQPVVATSGWSNGTLSIGTLVIDPPLQPDSASAGPSSEWSTPPPRELVFLIDRSGSMRGPPLQACQAFMVESLKRLGPNDTFRVVAFSSEPSVFSDSPIQATPENVARAIDYVRRLEADGGTEMMSGLSATLSAPPEPGRMRLVTLLTDGQIGNEAEVVRAVNAMRGDARVYALGVGSSPNRYLLRELAKSGRGAVRVLDATLDMEAEARAFADRFATPVMTDLAIDWGTARVDAVTPDPLPDLFQGQPLRVLAQFDEPGVWPVKVTGRVNGEPRTLDAEVYIPPGDTAAGDALPKTWARARIEDKLTKFTIYGAMSRRGPTDDDTRATLDALQSDITLLGLEHGLVTPWTAFVAISNHRGQRQEKPVYQPSPEGWGAPEPQEWMAMLGLLLLTGLVFVRR